MDLFSLKGTNNTYLIYRFIFEPVKSNMYVIINNNESIIIDPNENEELKMLLCEKKIIRVSIILTHEHYDHTSGVNWLQNHYNTTLYCHEECAKAIAVKRKNNPALIALVWANMDKKDGGSRYKNFKEHFVPYTIQADVTFDEYAEWIISGIKIRGISTPGHCPGSCFYWLDHNLVFTGDTILKDDPIILKFPESEGSIYASKTLPYIRSLDTNIILIPGHGDPFLLKDANYIR